MGNWSHLTTSSRSLRIRLQTLTDASRHGQERAWVYIYTDTAMAMRVGSMRKLPPSSAGEMFPSPMKTTIAAQHTDKGQTMPWSGPTDKLLQRHHLLLLTVPYAKLTLPSSFGHASIFESECYGTLSMNNAGLL